MDEDTKTSVTPVTANDEESDGYVGQDDLDLGDDEVLDIDALI
jgi:hypothetical protein